MEYIAFDSHKQYTWTEREEADSGRQIGIRLERAPGAIGSHLAGCKPGTAVAVAAFHVLQGQQSYRDPLPRRVVPGRRKRVAVMPLARSMKRLTSKPFPCPAEGAEMTRTTHRNRAGVVLTNAFRDEGASDSFVLFVALC